MPLIPYFYHPLVTLYCGDYRDVLPQLPKDSVDMVLADLPYNQNYVATKMRQKSLNQDIIMGDDGSFLPSELSKHITKILRPHRHLYFFYPEYLDSPELLPYCKGFTELIWDKELTSAGDVGNIFSKSFERITFAVNNRGGGKANGRGNLAGRLRQQSILRFQRLQGVQQQNHLTEKPELLLRHLIECSSFLGETILDPVCGSGSSLRAALKEGRKSIGIDKDPSVCQNTAELLKAEVKDIDTKIINLPIFKTIIELEDVLDTDVLPYPGED